MCRFTATARFALCLAVVLVTGACSSAQNEPAATIGHVSTTLPPPPPTAPLTGAPPAPGVSLTRRPVAIKVDNAPRAQPQAGLDAADLVYEEVVEGGLTRFMAVFQSQDADPVGPVRSVRPVDIDLARWLVDPVLVFSGGAGVVIEDVERSGLTWFDENDTAVLWEDPARRAPHDLVTSTGAVYAALGGAVEGPPPDLATFDETAPPGSPASAATIPFSETEEVTWHQVPATGRWVRLRDGAPQILVSGAPLEVDNLVVQSVRFVPTGIFDAAGNPSPAWEVVGSGRLFVVRDGVVVEGSWSRPTPSEPTRLLDAAGTPIPLRPGRTWWSLLPDDRVPAFA
ncbi:MAG: DUF3048 domain-containing protein [Acidimicrobiia bacterium]|nr:DUF3048 domain-containing protein [Acidimicrobiia bacterium]